MTAPVKQCICGHLVTEHTDGTGKCNEPTGRCQCEGYSELCPVCQHGQYSHDGPNGVCTRTVQKTRMPCGCANYPTPEEGS